MTSLAASIFHKHSLYEFCPVPLSPPATDSEPMQPTPISRSTSAMFGELDHTLLRPQAETPTRLGRVSTLTYNHSGLREPQERSIHKSSKSLVVIIPPECFSQEHGQLGHTLSSGPRNRLSQGILMPLFPTMYAQLTAIAREFNFPSTLGLCLYLQISDTGITATPRISDDSWQFLWGHFLNGSNPVTGPHSLPISGRIEFDIDLSKARWYTSWISASRRDTMLSHMPSMSHSRGDSRTLFVDEQINDEQPKNTPVIQPTQNLFRHIPKTLSLLSRPPSTSGTVSPEAIETQIISALSPILQDDEPPTAKQKLEIKVNSWRANTSLAPTRGTETSDPKAVSTDDLPVTLAKHASPELNLDDFTWSISSAGPPSEKLNSPLSCEHLPSVHLDRRLESVCLTPSVCTSFGPFDYDLHSPMTDVSRIPSLDIAHRMVDDCPPTPTTATSWGALLSYPPSPLSECRPPSVHLDRRGEFSRPTTPATATSWGAPMSWPATPLSEYRAPSVDMGGRSGWSRPVTPSTATTWGPPMSYPPTPIIPFYVHTPDAGQGIFDSYETSRLTWDHVWPYRQHQFSIDNVPVTPQKADEFEDAISSNYPYLKIYPDVYPYYDLYPAIAASDVEVEVMPNEPLPTMLQAAYPALNIYPACYPHFDIYPATHRVVGATDVKQADAQPLHPVKILLPGCSGYPDFNLYPDVSPSLEVRFHPCPPIKLAVNYPYFDLYPAVYPYYNLYPAAAASEVEVIPNEPLPTMLQTAYPVLNIYPACYPHFDIYPSYWVVDATDLKPADAQPPAHPAKVTLPGCSGYPDFSLYSNVPSSLAVEEILQSPPIRLAVEYPFFDLYPSVYPFVTPYPSHNFPNGNIQMASQRSEPNRNELKVKPTQKSLSVVLETSYPNFNIYPAVYPAFEIYPSVLKLDVSLGQKDRTLSSESSSPLNRSFLVHDIHTAISRTEEDTSNEMLHGTRTGILGYPVFNIYPAVYPYLEPYPAWWADVE